MNSEHKKPTVLVAGCFDPIHEGHIDHIKKAGALADRIIIVTHTDEMVTKKKGYCRVRQDARMMLLRGLLQQLNLRGFVTFANEDFGNNYEYEDGIPDTLGWYKPSIFARGGDRTPSNLPAAEFEACRQHGIVLVFGIGDLLNSSTKKEV